MTTELTVSKPRLGKRHKIRKWIIRLAWALAIFVPLFFAVSALGSRFGLWSWKVGFGKLSIGIGPKLMLATLIVGVLTTLLSFIIKPRKGLLAGVLALAIPLAGMGMAASMKAKAGSLPFIHDVTTDTQDPPMFSEALLAERAKTEGVNTADYIGKTARSGEGQELVSVLQVEAYPDIRSLVMSEDTGDVYDRALEAASKSGWDIVTTDREAGIIEATDTTFWYGFKDDVIIRIRPSEGGGSVLDVRSLSRVGGSDIGKNADRIRAFTARMKSE